jgi:glycosyltransferase involved in cell wall biosynthesis
VAEPPKVLWISCVGEKGGAEVYLLNLLRRLDRTRFAPEVALLRPGPLEKELRDLEANVHLLRPHRMRDVPAVLGAVGQLTRLLRDGGFALVHSNAFRAHVYGGLAAWRAGVPEVWSVHTAEQPGWITRAVLSIPTSHVIANAPRTADWFVARHLPTSLIWPSIDVEQLARALPRSEVAQRLELPADARWVTVGARLQRYKGQEFFLRALAALPEKFRDVHGVVMGGALFGAEQDYPESLRRLAAELGLAERVHFTGFIG